MDKYCIHHAGLNELDFPEYTVTGNVMLTGCTGGNAVVDAISSRTLEQPDGY